MGYNGKTEKNRRFKGVVVDEAYRMIQTGLEMIDIIKEIRESYNDPQYEKLDVRVGIHTGKVVAGIIGSRIVRYDILGEGVLITNKI
jgi:class 3 adenylate cyclase